MLHSIKAIITTSLLLVVVFSHTGYAKNLIKHHQVKAEITGNYKSLIVETAIKIDITDDKPLHFILNKAASIKSLSLDNDKAVYDFLVDDAAPSGYINDGRLLVIKTDHHQGKGKILNISYELPLAKINYVTQEFSTTSEIEIGFYTAWFLITEDNQKFSYSLDMKAPADLKLTGNAEVVRIAPGKWHLENAGQVYDIVVLGSPKLETLVFKLGQSELLLSHFGTDPEIISLFSTDVQNMLSLFSEKFGPMSSLSSRYHFVLATREEGSSYSRGNFAVMTKVDPADYHELYKVTAHEIGHFWWTGADSGSWQDWLNEGFAEYASMIALEAKYAGKYSGPLWNKAQEKFATLPAIEGLSRNDKYAHSVLYQKGAYLLHQLRSKGTDKQFFGLLKSAHLFNVDTTEQFIKQVKKYYPQGDVDWFKKALATGNSPS